MRNLKIITILLVMLGMLGVPGCTGGQTYSSTAGVRINDMSFDYASMTDDPKERVSLAFELENVGSKQMTGDGRYWVYGPAIGDPHEVNEDGENKYIWRTSDTVNLKGTLGKNDFLNLPQQNLQLLKENSQMHCLCHPNHFGLRNPILALLA